MILFILYSTITVLGVHLRDPEKAQEDFAQAAPTRLAPFKPASRELSQGFQGCTPRV